jgi:hypothetical protein
MPEEQPLPFMQGRRRRQIGREPGPPEQDNGPVRQGRGIGLDGETVKYVFGSVATSSSTAASSAAVAAAAAGSAAGRVVWRRGYEGLKLEHGAHNAQALGRGVVSGAGLVLNVAAGTARIAASGTGAVLNFAADRLLPAPLTEDEYRQMVAHEARVAEDHEYMTAQAKLHQRALQVQQENQRLADDAANQRKIEVAMAKARQQELDFQDARSVSSTVTRQKFAPGRAGNLAAQMQNAQLQDRARQHVRNEDAVQGFGRRLARGLSSLF